MSKISNGVTIPKSIAGTANGTEDQAREDRRHRFEIFFAPLGATSSNAPDVRAALRRSRDLFTRRAKKLEDSLRNSSG
jgi:hypothetical protein